MYDIASSKTAGAIEKQGGKGKRFLQFDSVSSTMQSGLHIMQLKLWTCLLAGCLYTTIVFEPNASTRLATGSRKSHSKNGLLAKDSRPITRDVDF